MTPEDAIPEALNISQGAARAKLESTANFTACCKRFDFEQAEAYRLVAMACFEAELDAFAAACRSVEQFTRGGGFG